MTQYYSRIDTALNGDVYSIPFSYMKESEISVYINDETITTWEFLNVSQIKLTEIPSDLPADSIVSIRRTTDITKKVVDYSNQSMLNKESLNLSQDQLLNAVQEIYDNNTQFEIDINEYNTQFATDIRAEVDEKVEAVSDAVEKLEFLEDSVEIANEAALEAIEQAQIASEQAQIVSEQAQDVLNIGEQIKTDLNTQLEEIITDITEETNKQIKNIQDIGFYMRDDKLYFINSQGEEEEFKTNYDELNNPYTLLDSKYSPNALYNASWLKSEGQWNSGAVYVTCYEGLLVEYNTEIEVGTTTTLPSGTEYTKKGLSVALSTEEYTDYDFVLNTADETFRLPLLDGSETIANYNINSRVTKEYVTAPNYHTTTKNCYVVFSGASTSSAGTGARLFISQGDGTFVQVSGCNGASMPNLNAYGIAFIPKGTNYYLTSASFNYCYEYPCVGNGSLYYYVGETVQNANLINAGRIEEKLSDLITIVETYRNGASGYNLYSNGFCEQWGRCDTGTAPATITLLKSYIDTNYNIQVTQIGDIDDSQYWGRHVRNVTTSSFQTNQYNNFFAPFYWVASGYVR